MCIQAKTQFAQTGTCTYLVKAPDGSTHKLRSLPEVLAFAIFYGIIDSKVCCVAAFETQRSVFRCTCTRQLPAHHLSGDSLLCRCRIWCSARTRWTSRK